MQSRASPTGKLLADEHPGSSSMATHENGDQPGTSKPFGVQHGAPGWVVQLRIAVTALGAILAPVMYAPTKALLLLFLVSYSVRMWSTESLYHRYFSHRAFRATRFVQCLFALLGTQNGQRGPLWWAAAHRIHHRYADHSKDPHSPQSRSFAHAFVGWLWDRQNSDTDLDTIPDYARFPELRWINKYYAAPFYGGGALLVLAGHWGWLGPGINGTAALLWGFFLPVTAVLVGVALVNTTCHMPRLAGGFRRYETPDSSVNRPLLALLTLGGGWHNNHHRYAVPARAGFAWWELDVAYYLLLLLGALGIVRDVKGALPQDVRRDGGLELSRTSRPAPPGA
jgi:stearoyl-CoA desaturase (Delta-9 desaturase)